MGKGGGREERERENIIKEGKTSPHFKNWSKIVLAILIKGKVHHQASEVKVVRGIFFPLLHEKKGSVSWRNCNCYVPLRYLCRVDPCFRTCTASCSHYSKNTKLSDKLWQTLSYCNKYLSMCLTNRWLTLVFPIESPLLACICGFSISELKPGPSGHFSSSFN